MPMSLAEKKVQLWANKIFVINSQEGEEEAGVLLKISACHLFTALIPFVLIRLLQLKSLVHYRPIALLKLLCLFVCLIYFRLDSPYFLDVAFDQHWNNISWRNHMFSFRKSCSNVLFVALRFICNKNLCRLCGSFPFLSQNEAHSSG